MKSIYSIHSPTQKRLILGACALIAIITPFTDTVYLPALKSVGRSLNAPDSDVAATVSAYLGFVGLGQLFWGSLSDHYGRLNVLYPCFCIYLAFTIGCIFVTNIVELIVVRSMQGLIVGSTIVTAQAVIADVFPVDERGSAMGAFLVNYYYNSLLSLL
jgi:DHA1 family bicyclomycin/chloramphenicol resistance-like MFS transporter